MDGFLRDAERERKRRRISTLDTDVANMVTDNLSLTSRAPISPPRRKAANAPELQDALTMVFSAPKEIVEDTQTTDKVPSPFQLTWIRDLPEKLNVNTVTLKDVLGVPLISECWEFNYLHDVDFLMEAFDEDIRNLVQVHVVHGFWRHEDAPGQGIRTQAAKYPNVTAHTAYMPEPYGTHHTKMMVLFRHDDTAQIVIHTANMIEQDWRNLSQAVWRSPFLPRVSAPQTTEANQNQNLALGSGEKFRVDFMAYLNAYNVKRPTCQDLTDELAYYDFSAIRGCLIGSVPGRHAIESDRLTAWGWPAMQTALSTVPSSPGGTLVAQISSIATLGVTDAWLSKSLFAAMSASSNNASKPSPKIIFPTADEVRRSLDGYNSGASIHIKTQNPQQQKQLLYLKPLLHHWAGDGAQHASGARPSGIAREAGRKRAAPHIKTYVRYKEGMQEIDWALVTSANISKQAWGEPLNKEGDVRIQSYELGVLVWPGLWDEEANEDKDGKRARMIPCFGKDEPHVDDHEESVTTIGFRMPYDLPLTKYGAADVPWCATASYNEPDWKGQIYNVSQ